MNRNTRIWLWRLFLVVVGFSMLSAWLIFADMQNRAIVKQLGPYKAPISVGSYIDPYDLDGLYDYGKEYLPKGTSIPNIIFDTNNPEDTLDLAFTIWCEVRSVSDKGYTLMPSVVMNRLHDPAWGNNMYDVLHEPGQFSCWGSDGETPVRKVTTDKKLFEEAVVQAHDFITGRKKPATTALYYHTYATKVRWSRKLTKVENDGAHFYFDKNVVHGR